MKAYKLKDMKEISAFTFCADREVSEEATNGN